MIKIHKSDGFSLIEVLLGVFIFAVGLLGIAALQLFAKQNSFDTIQRTNAALLAAEMAERIRANPKNAQLYVSSITDIATTDVPTATCDSTSKCAGDALPAYDLRAWYESILGMNKEDSSGNATGGFINPSACITTATNAGGAVVGYNVAIAWRSKTPLANSTANNCGEDESVYGAGNRFRRVLVYTISLEDA